MRKSKSFRPLQVLSSERIAPKMQRLRLAGADLGHFDTDANLHARLHVPAQSDEASIAKFRSLLHDGGTEADLIATRYYTIRRIDACAGWLDIDFALHACAGPGSHFACAAKPGDVCGLSGPCGLGIKKADRYLLVGDETALPAIARIAEGLPCNVTGRIILLADPALYGMAIAKPAGIHVEWIPQNARPVFFESLDALAENFANSPDHHFIWMAGEHDLLGHLRPLISGTPKARHLCVPYWTR